MGLMDKLLETVKYGADGEEFVDDDEMYDYDDEPRSTRNAASSRKQSVRTATMDDDYEYDSKPQRTSRVSSYNRKGTSRTMSNGMEVNVIKPTNVEDSREITDTLLEGHTVVLNVEGLDTDIAQRIIDFISGSVYAIGGNLQKISHSIFIATPKSVEISGNFQEILSGGFDIPALRNKF